MYVLSQVVLPYYEKYSSDIDRMMAAAASSAEVIIKSAVDKVEDTKTEWEVKMADKMYVY